MRKLAVSLTCSFIVGALAPSSHSTATAQEEDTPRFHHVHLLTSDPAAAISFYTKHFQVRKEQYVDLTDALWTGDSWILFTQQATPPKSTPTSAVQHIGWGATDMMRAYQRQLDLGAPIHTPMRDISHMVIDSYRPFLYSYITGPDGVIVEINSSNNNNFGHIHLASRNPEAAGEWYRTHLGLTRAKKFRSSPIPAVDLVADHISFLVAPESMVAAATPNMKGHIEFESTQGHVVDHLAFSVKDIKKTIDRLRSNGVKVLVEPTPVLSNGKLHTAFIEGPDRVLIEIVQDSSPRPSPLSN
jgi:catechol 2,3-dioxygenase-like lactoylglutathione lyase family enzyme